MCRLKVETWNGANVITYKLNPVNVMLKSEYYWLHGSSLNRIDPFIHTHAHTTSLPLLLESRRYPGDLFGGIVPPPRIRGRPRPVPAPPHCPPIVAAAVVVGGSAAAIPPVPWTGSSSSSGGRREPSAAPVMLSAAVILLMWYFFHTGSRLINIDKRLCHEAKKLHKLSWIWPIWAVFGRFCGVGFEFPAKTV